MKLKVALPFQIAIFSGYSAAATRQAVPSSSMIPLTAPSSNPDYFTDDTGKAIILTGSQTRKTFQDTSQGAPPAPFDFAAFVTFLHTHCQRAIVLWTMDLPTHCNWGPGGAWQELDAGGTAWTAYGSAARVVGAGDLSAGTSAPTCTFNYASTAFSYAAIIANFEPN
jgi:hypothetical protein